MNKNKEASLLSHLISILVLPFNVTVIIPALLLYFFPGNIGWGAPFPLLVLLVLSGAVIMLAGLLLMIITVKHFAVRGEGTLAPWDPPKNLVVSGPYQYSRNPMISGAASILLGEVLFFGSAVLFLWFLFFTIVNYMYFIVGEEPHLEKKFGKDYLEYKKNVPRLVPRRTPWKPE